MNIEEAIILLKDEIKNKEKNIRKLENFNNESYEDQLNTIKSLTWRLNSNIIINTTCNFLNRLECVGRFDMIITPNDIVLKNEENNCKIMIPLYRSHRITIEELVPLRPPYKRKTEFTKVEKNMFESYFTYKKHKTFKNLRIMLDNRYRHCNTFGKYFLYFTKGIKKDLTKLYNKEIEKMNTDFNQYELACNNYQRKKERYEEFYDKVLQELKSKFDETEYDVIIKQK